MQCGHGELRLPTFGLQSRPVDRGGNGGDHRRTDARTAERGAGSATRGREVPRGRRAADPGERLGPTAGRRVEGGRCRAPRPLPVPVRHECRPWTGTVSRSRCERRVGRPWRRCCGPHAVLRRRSRDAGRRRIAGSVSRRPRRRRDRVRRSRSDAAPGERRGRPALRESGIPRRSPGRHRRALGMERRRRQRRRLRRSRARLDAPARRPRRGRHHDHLGPES